MANTKTKNTKGSTAEEALRDYFNSLGFYSLRGVPYKFRSFDITDIDLWLYNKNSTVTREIINVDIKRKRTPQAIERIFWTKGLQEVLGCDKCIVATTDKRKDTRDFGDLHGVSVLDGNFLNRLTKHYTKPEDRLNEEELLAVLKEPCLQDNRISWPKYYNDLKKELIQNLNYNGANLFLEKGKFAIDDYLSGDLSTQASVRMFLICISFFLLVIDYKTRSLAYLDAAQRRSVLEEGLRYGESGKKRADEIFNTAINLIEKTGEDNLFASHNFEQEINEQIQLIPADTLSIYLTKSEIMKSLFDLSKEFIKTAYLKDLPSLNDLTTGAKAFIGVFCDFHMIDRKLIL